MFNVNKIREDFPILKLKIDNNPLVYFDNAATTQKPLCVIDKISELYKTQNANIHRGVHYLSQKATEAHEKARLSIAKFINAPYVDEIIFTRGTTESINLVAQCFSEICEEGDEILISEMEHHSNIVSWQLAAERFKLKIKVIPIDTNGDILIDQYKQLFSPKTKMVAITHVSNVLGTINPIRQMVEIAHNNGAAVLVDGAQAVAHLRVDVQDIGADFYAFSGHKIYAPTGIGVLFGKSSWLNRFKPYQGGGEMISSVTFEKTTYNVLPYKFEAGTPDFISSVALATAINYIQQIDFDQIIAYEDELLKHATNLLLQIPDLEIYGKSKHKCGVVAFNVRGVHNFDIGTLLDKTGVSIRTGHHCAEPLVAFFKQKGMARASFAFYNTKQEIDTFVENLKKCLEILR